MVAGLATTLALAIARAQADEVLRTSEERLRLAMAAGRMGAWDLNLHTGDATWDARQCELFGRTMDRPLRRAENSTTRSIPTMWNRCKKPRDAPMGPASSRPEFRVVHPDGTIHWLCGQGETVRNEQGHPVRMIGINYDITERNGQKTRCSA